MLQAIVKEIKDRTWFSYFLLGKGLGMFFATQFPYMDAVLGHGL